MFHRRRLLMICLFSFAGFTVASETAEAQLDSVFRDSELNDANFSAWKTRLQAKPAELVWQNLPWLTSYHEGLQRAAAEDKPLLLWVMNGHPFGCT